MTQGTIFNIQRFSTHDGPGIRTVVFLQGCPLRCAWCQNPESQPFEPVLLHNTEMCVGCGRCAQACPRDAIRIRDGKSCVDRAKCVVCGECAAVCGQNALTVSGRRVTAEEVLEEVLKDQSYYRNSGGGLTLSGGEAAAQPDFALALLEGCRKKYIHTAVETCGCVPTQTLLRFVPVTKLFLFDIKAVDGEKHRRGTGRDNALILRNAKTLAETGCALRVRMPLIPGFNDDPADVTALRGFVENELGLGTQCIELLPYNPLGEVKFTRLGRTDRPSHQRQSDEAVARLERLLR